MSNLLHLVGYIGGEGRGWFCFLNLDKSSISLFFYNNFFFFFKNLGKLCY